MRQGCKLIKLGESTAFICGGESKDHQCNEDAIVYELNSGERIFLKDGDRDYYKHHFKEICAGSVACSICGRAMIDNAPYL